VFYLILKIYKKDYPTNKTTRLCYARAVGMKKQPEKALTLFTALRINYPDNLEMKLNYAELLLWNKNFGGTKVFYSTLGGRKSN
jgi:type 1 glutamine amidotransferase